MTENDQTCLLFRRAVIAVLLFSTWPLHAADRIDLRELHDRCVPMAPFHTLEAIVSAESNGNPNAIQLDYPQKILKRWQLSPGNLSFSRQPRNAREALHWATLLQNQGISVDLGLMQVSRAEAGRRDVSAAALLDPCTNLKVGWSIFEDAYRLSAAKHGHSQEALWHALSRYNTGNEETGFGNGYLAHVMRAVLEQERRASAKTATGHSRAAEQNYRQSDRGSSR